MLKNKRGPRAEPWYMSHKIEDMLESWLFYETNCSDK